LDKQPGQEDNQANTLVKQPKEVPDEAVGFPGFLDGGSGLDRLVVVAAVAYG
jgi:hypothetical protein